MRRIQVETRMLLTGAAVSPVASASLRLGILERRAAVDALDHPRVGVPMTGAMSSSDAPAARSQVANVRAEVVR